MSMVAAEPQVDEGYTANPQGTVPPTHPKVPVGFEVKSNETSFAADTLPFTVKRIRSVAVALTLGTTKSPGVAPDMAWRIIATPEVANVGITHDELEKRNAVARLLRLPSDSATLNSHP